MVYSVVTTQQGCSTEMVQPIYIAANCSGKTGVAPDSKKKKANFINSLVTESCRTLLL